MPRRSPPGAVRMLQNIPPGGRWRIHAAVELLAETPRPPGAKKRSCSSGHWRVRSRDYRILYEIYDAKLIVMVVVDCEPERPHDIDGRKAFI